MAGVHHLPIVFVDPSIEQARLAARAAAPVPLSRAAQAYIAERNSKRERMTDIQPHRLWQTSDAGGHHPASGDLAHLSPLGWEHINLTGAYHWDTSPTLGPDEFSPLRTHAHDFAPAA